MNKPVIGTGSDHPCLRSAATCRRPYSLDSCVSAILRYRRLGAGLLIIFLLGPATAFSQTPQQTADTPPPWNKVGETGAVVLYVDQQSVRRDGNVRRIIEMQDLKSPDPDGVLSRRYINEYDCSSRMNRIGQVSSYTQNMLGGSRRFLIEEWGYWRAVQPNTLFSVVLSSLCGDILRN